MTDTPTPPPAVVTNGLATWKVLAASLGAASAGMVAALSVHTQVASPASSVEWRADLQASEQKMHAMFEREMDKLEMRNAQLRAAAIAQLEARLNTLEKRVAEAPR